MKYIDAHLHIADCENWKLDPASTSCSSCHTEGEFLLVEELAQKYPQRIFPTFGIHPQNPDTSLFPLLDRLAGEGRIAAVGEAGFDLFTPEFAATWKQQEQVWRLQLGLARKRRLPLVVHCRRAMDRIFLYTKELSALPAVIFHAFPGSCQEAGSLLGRGVEAYFSFGKELLRGRKNSILCVERLPLDRLLAETDAPYQTLKGQEATPPSDIRRVYREFAGIRGIAVEELQGHLERNFRRIFSPTSVKG